ncbi:MAG: CBS domain-containing protein [Planctomycetes bacterium]|nr:CBS domain-containing protein [Planctomycetota bacterium]
MQFQIEWLLGSIPGVLGAVALVWWAAKRVGHSQGERAALERMTKVLDRHQFRQASGALAKEGTLSQFLDSNSELLGQGAIEVRHLMTERVETVHPEATLDEITTIMGRTGCRHLIVCKEYRQVVGVISDRDLLARPKERAEEIMSKNIVSVDPLTPIAEVVHQMLANNISSMLVCRNGLLCGIVTSADILLLMHCTLELLKTRYEQLAAPVRS